VDSGLIGIVSRREQQSPEEEQKRKGCIDVGLCIVQRKRELTADTIDIRKQQLCFAHRQCPRVASSRPTAANGIDREASESMAPNGGVKSVASTR
jgi:hypothetical protein